jgi:formate dehydrogenase maturation protein FdhE
MEDWPMTANLTLAALKKLAKRKHDNAEIVVNNRSPSPEEKATARDEMKALRERQQALEAEKTSLAGHWRKLLDAAEAHLNADADNNDQTEATLTHAVSTSRRTLEIDAELTSNLKRIKSLQGVLLAYRYSVKVDKGLFIAIVEQADSLEELAARLEK